MINADTEQLKTKLKQHALQIKLKEISVFTSNLGVLSTQSAFLVGLCYGGMNMAATWGTHHPRACIHETLFYISTSIGAGLSILTLSICSWCIIFGPGLAIRGPDGSISRAAEGLYSERKYALRFFWAGVFFCLLSGIFLGMLKFNQKASDSIAIIISLFAVVAALYLKYITRPRFSFIEKSRTPNEILVSGFDPEAGEHVQVKKSFASSSFSSNSKENGSGSGSSFSQIDWLVEKGFLSQADAATRRKELYNRQANSASS